MNASDESQQPPVEEPPPSAGNGFEANRLRTVLEAKRSSEDRMVGGVCAGVSRHLDIDPVVLRVLVAAFTIVGGAGLIMYVAAWILMPSDDADKSIAAEWFNLDHNEGTVRTVGLIVAAIVAISAGTGIVGDAWNTPFPWFGLLVLGALYLFVIRPAQKRAVGPRTSGADTHAVDTSRPVRAPRTPTSSTLTWVTIFSSVVVIGIMAAVDNQNAAMSLTFATYVMAVLSTIGVGLIIGSWFGSGGPLVALGLLVAVVLAVASALPAADVGQPTYRPLNSQSVDSAYKIGAGELTVDLTGVSDPAGLAGKHIEIDSGVGATRVIVPARVNVGVDARITAGEIHIFDRKQNGTNIRMRYLPTDPTSAAVTLDVHNTFGSIEVIKK